MKKNAAPKKKKPRKDIEAIRLEQDRLDLLAQLGDEDGPDWEEQYRPGTMGCHELLDRTANLADAVEDLVQTHPSCIRNPEWFRLAALAVNALNELYQRIGDEHLEEDSESSSPR
jgi:hypothetical protein